MRVAKLVAPKQIELFTEEFHKKPGAGEAVVEVKAVGICGTDLHVFQGERSDVKLPRVMGHELSGVVLEVGTGVSNVKAGDRVVFDPVVSCGTCRICQSGHENVCDDVKCFGVQMDGGFQDYIVVDAKRLCPYTKDISFNEASLAEPFSVASNILSRTATTETDRVVIMGAGTIGMAVLQAAKGIGAKVLISDIEDKKLQMAVGFGANAVVNSRKESIIEALEEFSPGGADVIIDAVGITALTELSIKLAAPCARIAVIAFDAEPAKIPPVIITKKELTLIGSRMNNNRLPEVIEWFDKDMVNPGKMISRIFPLEQIQEAFEYTLANSSENIKTIIEL